MTAARRRDEILQALAGASGPVSAAALAARLGVSRQVVVGDVALLRAAAAKAGVCDITQKGSTLRFTLAVFRPEALVAVCGLSKYKFRLTLSAGETPMLTLKLKPGEDTLEAALAEAGEDTFVIGGESLYRQTLDRCQTVYVTKLHRADNATVVITHYQRLLDYIVPDVVHVLYKGRIIYSGDKSLALKLEKEGYDWLINEYDK